MFKSFTENKLIYDENTVKRHKSFFYARDFKYVKQPISSNLMLITSVTHQNKKTGRPLTSQNVGSKSFFIGVSYH
jgi:hypothetical protein